jgi:membrane protein YdbS with pleckstrin-like domain
LKSLYRIYLLIGVWAGILTWLVPLVFLVPASWSLLITVPILCIVLFVSLWIPWYYQTLAALISPDEIVWQHGALFRHMDIVPCHQITSIDIVQGPIMRFIGISTLKIRFRSTTTLSGEIHLVGLEHPDELQEQVQRHMQK